MTGFLINSFLLGLSLSLDAFAVSIVYGLQNDTGSFLKKIKAPLIFAVFQFVMPLIGWSCVSFLMSRFSIIEKYISFIALILLCILGAKMIIESRKKDESEKIYSFSIKILLLQGIATSIDALSVGFAFASKTLNEILISVTIIGAVTFAVCTLGVFLGRSLGPGIKKYSGIIGGIILIAVGFNIAF